MATGAGRHAGRHACALLADLDVRAAAGDREAARLARWHEAYPDAEDPYTGDLPAFQALSPRTHSDTMRLEVTELLMGW